MTNSSFPRNICKAALLTGCFFVCACENDVNEVRDLGKKSANIEEGRNIETWLSMNGKMRAHLTAPLLLRSDEGRKSEFPNTLHVDFYNDSTHQIESQLNARYGSYLENENKVYLRDSVVIFNKKGDTLFAEDMYFDQVTQKFHTDKKVIVVRDFGRTRFTPLKGLIASQDFSNITFYDIQDGSYFFVPDSTQSGATVAPIAADTSKTKTPKISLPGSHPPIKP